MLRIAGAFLLFVYVCLKVSALRRKVREIDMTRPLRLRHFILNKDDLVRMAFLLAGFVLLLLGR